MNMHLSDDALDIGYAVRLYEGADVKGVGPDTALLLSLDRVAGKEPSAIRAALKELERYGMFHVSWCIGTDRPGVPRELRDIAGVSILEPMQQMFDDMEL
jgi:hypothetical protein